MRHEAPLRLTQSARSCVIPKNRDAFHTSTKSHLWHGNKNTISTLWRERPCREERGRITAVRVSWGELDTLRVRTFELPKQDGLRLNPEKLRASIGLDSRSCECRHYCLVDMVDAVAMRTRRPQTSKNLASQPCHDLPRVVKR